MSEFNTIRAHWNDVGGVSYRHFWKGSFARKRLSKNETEFVKGFIPPKNIKALDYGIGSGRFLNILLVNSTIDSEIFGLDISDKMVEYCREEFGNQNKLRAIETITNLKDVKRFDENFHLITAIRALKYNSDWKKYLVTLFDMLENDGVIIFTMPKKYLFTKVFKQRNLFRVSIGEISELASQYNMKIIEIKGFAKIPDFFYRIDNVFFSKVILLFEDILRVILGTKRFDREIFYVLQKKIIY
jgi:SAM-dependent methyltransferase